MCIAISVAELVSAYPVCHPLSYLILDVRGFVFHRQSLIPAKANFDSSTLHRNAMLQSWVGLQAGSIFWVKQQQQRPLISPVVGVLQTCGH